MPTLARVLGVVERAAKQCVADHLRKDHGVASPTEADVVAYLVRRDVTCCHLMCSRTGGWNHVYVRIVL